MPSLAAVVAMTGLDVGAETVREEATSRRPACVTFFRSPRCRLTRAAVMRRPLKLRQYARDEAFRAASRMLGPQSAQ
jgi:hypothetical protein